ncbi:hypothetical protein CHLNCDRAFT_59336 [Chlorella variabilis]|uniref:Uncharacterized protein n=1 Tax=Chlorella variabilis TaxID=554065 RepID=E1ZSW0_CHLVA|nr:hypothetical protein CHLNCDRAFT_59336 [Chlorella variabilis]EFN51105.1 hypothetical protein CHLNCDRAFT_59336 [Chlorella variabilis]|eukprot:XP_005843207.1 hypothetical protein CHLNCDRAFT_59336 [Chlorella variabilis]
MCGPQAAMLLDADCRLSVHQTSSHPTPAAAAGAGAAMANFLGQPYMGPASVPHANPDFFKVYFAGAHLAVAMLTVNGRFLGTEVRPRKFNRDYILSCCDEAARRREALRGRTPRTWVKGRPLLTDHSWERMFNSHLHWKRWAQERMVVLGGLYHLNDDCATPGRLFLFPLFEQPLASEPFALEHLQRASSTPANFTPWAGMLCGPCLSPCSQHWRAGSGVSRILGAGERVAVGLEDGGTLLFSEHDLGAPLSELPAGAGRCSAAACTPDGGTLLLGVGAQLRAVALAGGPNPSPEPLDLGGEQPDAPVACIACQEHANVFAIARGSCVHVLDGTLQEQRRIGPLPAAVQQLAWAGDTLIAATPGALHTWTHSGALDGPTLPSPSPDARFLCVAASPQPALLAASCDEKEVRCWDLASLLSSRDGEPLRLREFDSPVTCMAWHPSGQYLATADGADCTVWDLADAAGAERACSIECCGHEPRTVITAMAFQPDGPLLATASGSGKVALFDCQQFRRGGVLAPAAFTRLDQAADAVTALHWLPCGRLVVGDAGGRLVCLQLMAAVPAEAAAAPQQQRAATAAPPPRPRPRRPRAAGLAALQASPPLSCTTSKQSERTRRRPAAAQTSSRSWRDGAWVRSPSGAHVPWMMVGAAGLGMAPGGGGTAAAGFAQYQAQPGMMQHMGMAVQPPAGIPAGYMAAPAGGPQGAPTGAYPPAMYAAAGGMAPQPLMAGQWMPYMQQMQQWAGTAPGYMMYQHPQYAGTAPVPGGGVERKRKGCACNFMPHGRYDPGPY